MVTEILERRGGSRNHCSKQAAAINTLADQCEVVISIQDFKEGRLHRRKTMKSFLFLSYLSLMMTSTRSVTITELSVPGVVEEGSENVLLDCNFTYNETEADQLEIKWYFNQDPAPFCQWIAGKTESRPQLIGSLFKDKVDLDFTAGHNNHTKYRGLLLHKPSTSMSGTYTCKVSTLESEAVSEARMLVYPPAVSTEFRQKKVEGSKAVNISCSFEGLYPAPTVKLTWASFELIEDAVMITPREGSYDVIIHKTLEHEELPAETVFGCEVTIPGTEYFLREEAIYHHCGKRHSDMEKIAELEEIRQRKSKFFYNTDSRYNMEMINDNDIAFGSASSSSQSQYLFTSIILCFAYYY